MSAGVHLDRRMRDVLDDAEMLYTAVRARRGPHVTPTVFSHEAGRLWAVAPRDSVKVRALRRDPRIGVLAGADGAYLVGAGEVRLVEALDVPQLRGVGELLRAPFGAARYLTRNTGHAINVVLDDPNPLALADRAVLSIELDRVALVAGSRVLAAHGDWPDTGLLPDADPATPPLAVPAAAPDWVSDLLAEDGEAALGWRSVDGPLALPGRWSGADRLARVPAGLMTLAGALPSGPACLTRAGIGRSMSAKTGVMLRGTGAATTRDGRALAGVTPDRVTWWRGRHAHTATPPAPPVGLPRHRPGPSLEASS